ncbi:MULTISPECIES: hypothetical protein [unclassified Streptomyces]|uniref:hypothetical protein n=1 Tax=unclassified Streptomyces TaxID=2593676 RepID=UPI002DDAB00C|nr:hypothetical protein [Streptomyces sp. NBC_00385]WRZ04622.1 hypothetical protein OG959_15270 [Streptomyces sp. NBC_00385]
MVRQHVKLTVVLVAVVLALTGFSSSSSGGKGGSKSRSGKSKSSSSSGGGCSSSKKSNGTYHDTDSDYDDDDYSSSSGSSGSTNVTPTATATDAPQAYVFRCATPRKGKFKAVTTSIVRITANAAGTHTYEIDVNLLDAVGSTVDTGEATVEAEGGETKNVSVRMDHPSRISRVKKCSVTAELSY